MWLFLLDVCHERGPDPGPCDQWQTHFYYNTNARRCEAFTYGGCDGSGNRFSTQSECESICISHEEPVAMDNKGLLVSNCTVMHASGSTENLAY